MQTSRALAAALLLLLIVPASPARAHPADVYVHALDLTLTPAGLLLNWEIKPGPMLASWLWHAADLDQDGVVDPGESRAWGEERAALLAATLDEAPFPLRLESVAFPGDLNGLQSNNQAILLRLSASWPQDGGNAHRLIVHNGMEEQSSVNWFTLRAIESAAFQQPAQQGSRLAVDLLRDQERAGGQAGLLAAWDSGTPALPPAQQGDAVMGAAEQVIPQLARETPQEILTGLVRREQFSPGFYLLALAISLALGALHALTPGHGKTVVAAYLVGARGTARHAVALGGIVTATHTGSVFLLGVITLVASRYILPTRLIPALELLSGALILGLGLYLLYQRLRAWRAPAGTQEHGTAHGHDHSHDHAHEHNHDHPHGHTHHLPDQEAVTWRSLIALGVSGGLVPCPDAIAILLVAVAINRLLLGLALIVAFSLGLAVVLIAIGLAMVQGGRLFSRVEAFNRFAPAMPVVSALVVLALGAALTWGALARWEVDTAAPAAQDGLPPAAQAGGFRLEQASVVHTVEDEDGHRQLAITRVADGGTRVLTDAPRGVRGFALAPDRARVVYVRQEADLGVSLWVLSLSGGDAREVVTCDPADCSQPVWSPDGSKVVFERLDPGQGLGLPTLWWLDVPGGQAGPVFQEAGLPGANPRWSPDGNWLSYSTPDGAVRLYNLSSGEHRILENTLGAAAVWAPDARSVLLRDVRVQEQGFVTHLLRYDLANGRVSDLDEDPEHENNLAAWSPEGEQVAVVRRDLSVALGDQIWLMRQDGSAARQLTSASNVLHGTLAWSPDGRYLLFDAYLMEAFPLQAHLQVLDLESGEGFDLGVSGYDPAWVW